MCITPLSGAPILNAAVHRMCVWHVSAKGPRHNFVLYCSPYDLVNGVLVVLVARFAERAS